MGRTRIAKAVIKDLSEKKESSQKRKHDLINYLKRLNQAHLNQKISGAQYVEILHNKNNGRNIKEWVDYYENYSKNCEKEIYQQKKKIIKNKLPTFFLSILFASILIYVCFFSGLIHINFTGFLIGGNEQKFSQEINLISNESTTYEWQLENIGQLQSAKLNGLIEGEGEVKIYIDNLLVLDSSKIKSEKSILTGGVVDEVGIETNTNTETITSNSETGTLPKEESSPSQGEFPTENTTQENTANSKITSQENTSNTNESNSEEQKVQTNSTSSEVLNQSEALPKEESSPSQGEPLTSEKNTTTNSNETTTEIQNQTIILIKNFKGICENTCNLKDLNLNKSSYTLRIEITNAKLQLDTIDYSIIPEEITQETNATIEENVTLENSTINTTQYQAILGQSVKWKKQISLDEAGSVNIELPKEAENIIVRKISEDRSNSEVLNQSEALPKEESSPSQGEPLTSEVANATIKEKTKEILSYENSTINEKSKEKPSLGITGNVVSTNEGVSSNKENIIEVSIQDNATNYEVTYETPAPYSVEEDLKNGKRVEIIGPETIHYENVLVFTNLSENLNIKDSSIINIHWIENDTYITPTKVEDKDNNGIYDYVEWIAPHLSNQTFDIIVITKAEHLDSNRNFISNIYEQVKALDNVWSETISSNNYVRVTFEIPLDNTKDITLYPRTVSGNPKIEVYEKDNTTKIAEFSTINDNQYNKIYLTNLPNGYTQDTFDLKIVGGEIQFDHIIDPATGTYCSAGVCDLYFNATTTTSNRTTWTVPDGITNISVLVVGGGGGSGMGNATANFRGGSGGAGGVVYIPSYSVNSADVFTVVVGGGGAGASAATRQGTNGSNSTFGVGTANNLTGWGGGGGGSSGTASGNLSGFQGGSGGGGARATAGNGTGGATWQTTTNNGTANSGNGSMGSSKGLGVNGAGGGGAGGNFSNSTGGTGISIFGIIYAIGGTGGGAAVGADRTGGGGSARGSSTSAGFAGGSGIVRIRYIDTTPTWSSNTTNGTVAGAFILHSVYWMDTQALSGYKFSFDNGNGTFYNSSWVSMTGTTNWSNVTKTINSTASSVIRWRFFTNDSSNQTNSTGDFTYTTTDIISPTYSHNSTNNTKVGLFTNFAINVSDNDHLNDNGGYIFSTNNTFGNATWVNDSFVPFTTTPSWANVTKFLNSTIGTFVGYRWYFNDTSGNLNSTPVYTLTTISNATICGTLSTENGNYILTENVTSVGTCFSFSAQNITLDCNGYWINYSTGGAANTYGVYITYPNTTIKNCNILDRNWASANTGRYGIYLDGTATGGKCDYSILYNNFINTSNSEGIYAFYGNAHVNLTSNRVYSNSSIAIRTATGNSHFSLLNNIGVCVSQSVYGFYMDGENFTLISNNGTGESGLLITNANNFTITNNIGTTSKTTSSQGIYLTCTNSNISGNKGIGTGPLMSGGIAIESSSNNTFTNNTGISTSWMGIGLHLSDNNTLINNTGASLSDKTGLALDASNNNILINNTANSTSENAIYIASSVNNTLTSNNASGGLYGYYINNANNNNFSNCSYTLGSTYDVRMEGTSFSNVFTNCSYSKESVINSGQLIRKWYYKTYVNDTDANSVSNVNITAINSTGNIQFTMLSDETGWIGRQEVTAYNNTGGVITYYSNYIINASKSGYSNLTKNYNFTITQNKVDDYFTLISYSDTTKPTISFESSTPGNASTVSSSTQTIVANISDASNTSSWIDFDNSLVGYWAMDYYNYSGIFDNSTYGDTYFGKYNGDINFSKLKTGQRGKAMQFDGVGDSINISNTASNFYLPNMTISAWAYANTSEVGSSSTWESSSIMTQYEIGNSFGWKLGVEDHGYASWVVVDSSVCTSDTIYGSTDLRGGWHLYTATRNGTSLSLFVDGQLVSTKARVCTITPITVQATIGYRREGAANANEDWNGSIDEVMIFNRTLNPTEIKALYSSQINKFNATFNNLALGQHNYTVYAIDEAGNANNSYQNFVYSASESTSPVIWNVTPISAVTLTDGPSPTFVIVNFSVYDANGASDLSNSTAAINFTKASEDLRANSSCVVKDYSGNYANYSCNVTMWYWDGAGSDWKVYANITDLESNIAVNDTTTFTVNPLTGFVISPSALTFSSITAGFTNQTPTSNFILNNTGNVDIGVGTIQINATDLVGENDNSKFLWASNFSASPYTGGNIECNITASATAMVNMSYTSVANTVLAAGNYSKNDGVTGQEKIYMCLRQVGSELTSQAYSTKTLGSWTIKIALVLVSIRRKKKKNSNNSVNIIFPITIFSNKLGALESLTKYMKENLEMSYHRIAELLNRDERTIWTSYNKSLMKQKELIKVKETNIFIPLSVLNNRKLTILESIIIYLKSKDMKYSEIANILERDQRNIWTIYSRVANNLNEKEISNITNISAELNIPLTIFSNKLGTLELISKYMKENLGMSYHEIARLLNRNDRTIWTSYNKSLMKQKELIKVKETNIFIPLSVLNNRKLTILESVIIYLKSKDMKYSEIANVLERDQRNVWTIYNKAKNNL